LGWQSQVLGPWQDQIVIVDGKKVRHAGVEIVNAADSQGRFLGSTVTARKSNGIPAAGQLLGGLDLTGKIILSDALPPNQERAQPMVFEGGGDYLMTVKGNQPTLEKPLETLFVKQGFSPSAHAGDAGAQAGAQPGPVGDSKLGMLGSHPGSSAVSRSPISGSTGNAG